MPGKDGDTYVFQLLEHRSIHASLFEINANRLDHLFNDSFVDGANVCIRHFDCRDIPEFTCRDDVVTNRLLDEAGLKSTGGDMVLSRLRLCLLRCICPFHAHFSSPLTAAGIARSSQCAGHGLPVIARHEGQPGRCRSRTPPAPQWKTLRTLNGRQIRFAIGTFGKARRWRVEAKISRRSVFFD